MDVGLLSTIKSFTKFWGLWYNHDSVVKPDLLFQVHYGDGSSGIVRCGSSIPGNLESVYDHFVSHMKICEAKELVPWESLENKVQLKKENMMRIPVDYSTREGCSVLLPSEIR